TLHDEGDVLALGGPRVLVAMPKQPRPASRRASIPPERQIAMTRVPEPVPVAHGQRRVPQRREVEPVSAGASITPPPPAMRPLPPLAADRRARETIRFGSPIAAPRQKTLRFGDVQVVEPPPSSRPALVLATPVTPMIPVVDVLV